MNKLAFLLLLSISFTACYEPQQGCLDTGATNFDVSADENCCCEYPQLVLNISHGYGSEGLKLDSVYTNAAGQAFRIHDVLFYVSDFALTQGGTAFQPEDTLHCYKFAGADSLPSILRDDIQLLRRNDDIAHSVGTFKQNGYFEAFSFRIGLITEADITAPGSVEVGHALRPQSEVMYDSMQRRYEHLRMVISRDTTAGSPRDTLHFYMSDFGNSQQIIQKATTFSHKSGYNLELNMRYDYQAWMDNVDFAASVAAIKASIISHLADGVTISQ